MELQFEQLKKYFDKKFRQIDNRFSQIDSKFDQIDNRFDQVDKKFDQIDDRFVKIDQKFDAQTQELKDYANQQTDTLAQIIETSISTPLQKHLENSGMEMSMHLRVSSLEHDVNKIKKGLLID